MKYCVCTEALFMDKADIYTALQRVHDCGFDAYEFWFWWQYDLKRLKQIQDQLGMTCVGTCAKFTTSTGDPDHQDVYLDDFKASVEAANQLECKNLIVQAGWEVPEVSHERHRATFIDTLQKAAPIAAQAGITLILEPLNIKVDHAGYHLWDTEESFQVLDQIGQPNVKLLFDIYHQQISNGFIIESLRRHLDQVGHIHAAGCPGRHEITTGELNYQHIFQALKDMGYPGYVGLEYFTDNPIEEGLEEAKKLFVY